MGRDKLQPRPADIILVIVLFLILLGFLSQCRQRKKAVFAGYAAGSIADYRLELYEDSSYYLSCYIFTPGDRLVWRMEGDTVLLIRNDTTCAKLTTSGLLENGCTKFRCLELMRFKKFDVAKEVKYPK